MDLGFGWILDGFGWILVKWNGFGFEWILDVCSLFFIQEVRFVFVVSWIFGWRSVTSARKGLKKGAVAQPTFLSGTSEVRCFCWGRKNTWFSSVFSVFFSVIGGFSKPFFHMLLSPRIFSHQKIRQLLTGKKLPTLGVGSMATNRPIVRISSAAPLQSLKRYSTGQGWPGLNETFYLALGKVDAQNYTHPTKDH